jgi:hypothetical protein
MSDFPIENKSTPQGAQTPLAVESKKSTHGFDSGEQNQLASAQGRGSEVAASSQTSSRGYSVSGVGVSVKPVDRKTLEGSYPGDSRSTAAPAQIPNQPAPREAVGQAPFGKNTPAGPAPSSFPGNQADSEAGN